MAILTLVIVILSIVFTARRLSEQRFAVEAVSERVTPGPGESGGRLWGQLLLDSSSNEISYRFRYIGLSAIQALHVRGPINVGSSVGPLRFALCGSPSTLVCDITSLPGEVSGELLQIEPGGTDVRPEIVNIRKEPWLYYVEVLTSNNPATPGALRAPLFAISGTP